MFQNAAILLLHQLKNVIKQCKNDDYSRSLEILSGGTVGQHIRHTLEFFICLYDAKNERLINYDNRKRDSIIESDKDLCLTVIDSIIEFLLKAEDNFEIGFKADYSLNGGENQTVTSSFYREVAYNIEHAIHHMALLKIAFISDLTYISIPDHFGVASSTVRYHSLRND